MSSSSEETGAQRPLRILTIDNGGLQAISILRVLKEVCKELSAQDGHSIPLRPCQLFDIIGGIGTGGWLAILLGRFGLRIDQCMSIYVTIANAIDPTRERQDGTAVTGGSVALDQDILAEKIDKIIAEHEIGEYLVDDKMDQATDTTSRRCHAFAVGVVKRAHSNMNQEYRLFRTYPAPPEARHQGPNPARCKVSSACAATAAARDFLGEWLLDADGVKYWDDTFPRTHNVSGLALDEAVSLFGEDSGSNLGFVLNISPGIVSPGDVKELQRQASMRSSTGYTTRRWTPRRLFSSSRLQDLAKRPPCGQPRSATDPGTNIRSKFTERSDTSNSTSSDASQTERGHQTAIKDRLHAIAQTSGRHNLYFRLELPARNDKPYLDDIAKPDRALRLAEDFLGENTTKKIMSRMVNNTITQFPPQRPITGGVYTRSPRQSYSYPSPIVAH